MLREEIRVLRRAKMPATIHETEMVGEGPPVAGERVSEMADV